MSGRRQLELERARREALRLEQVRNECTKLASACDRLLAEVRDVAVQQLAAADLRQCVERLREVKTSIQKEPDVSRTELESIASHIQLAVTRAEAGARQWSEAQVEVIAEARRTRTLAESTKRGQAAQRLADRSVELAEQGSLEQSAQLASEARTATRTACDAVLDERVRREVVKSLVTTLKGMGFVLVGPTLEDGRVVLEGRLTSGRRARFEVHLDGEMEFDLDGYEGRKCAEDMEKVEVSLRDRFGVRLGPPQVIWKNPDRISKGARGVPSSGQKRK